MAISKVVKGLLACLAVVAALGGSRDGFAANTCNGFLSIDYDAPNFSIPGDVLTVEITLGSGSIGGGTQIAINRVRFDLDCNTSSPLGLGCADEGSIVQYEGDSTIATTCPGSFSSTNATANQLVFTPSAPIEIDAGTPSFCVLAFKVKVLGRSIDATPGRIEQVAGYSSANGDAICDNNLESTSSQTGAIITCPDCNDNDACTQDTCSPDTGVCSHVDVVTPTCDDNNACTADTCVPATGQCSNVDNKTPTCDDNNACTSERCNTTSGQCETTSVRNCSDNNACTTEHCNTTSGQCETDSTVQCEPDADRCTTKTCNPANGQCQVTNTVTCSDPNCELCEPDTGQCVFDRDRPGCGPAGCRVTAGGNNTLGGSLAGGKKTTFGGQVGAPCGCSGCFGTLDGTDKNDLIQGNWTHNRHKGRLKASEFNSLECGCDGVFDGKLCNPGNRPPGPEPRPAPANMMCFTGVGDFDGTLSAFRVDLEDRGEPGNQKNGGELPDVYRTRIWIPKADESANALAQAACCGKTELDIREPDVDDGGDLVQGNMQIHPTLPNTNKGICPPPSTSCED